MRSRPLDGITVVALEHAIAAPFCTRQLADLGARVLQSFNAAALIASKPALAVRFAKQAINQGLQTDSQTAMSFELYAAAILFDTDDRKEGMRAFVEKRPPVLSDAELRYGQTAPFLANPAAGANMISASPSSSGPRHRCGSMIKACAPGYHSISPASVWP
ncbi:MAG: hypothetical protein F2735_00165 [Actinobacteria bacterium]|nr:hypothetical protein [Actinomycetota bacterium]